MHEECIKVTILGCGCCKQFPANQNVKYECFRWASKYSILLAGSVCTYICKQASFILWQDVDCEDIVILS